MQHTAHSTLVNKRILSLISENSSSIDLGGLIYTSAFSFLIIPPSSACQTDLKQKQRGYSFFFLSQEVIMSTTSEIVPLQNLQYSTTKERKKQEQRMQVRNARPEECGKTTYKSVAKAIAIASIPTMVKIKAQTKCFSRNFSPLCMVIKK